MARLKQWLPLLTIALAGSLAILPVATGPVRLNDSFWIDLVWLDQFSRQLAAGDLFPRWLHRSHGGLGSPVFFYYPPLSFYLGSLFALLGLSTWAALVATFWTGLVASGCAMWAWLRTIAARRPLLGALLFMLAPYHLLNITGRGALAEFTATALIPVIAIGIHQSLRRNTRGAPVLLAIAYAALIATHLPLALLVSAFLVGPWLLLHPRSKAVWTRAAPALALGIGLAGITLVPALALGDYRDTANMWPGPSFRPWNWSLWQPHLLPGDPRVYQLVGCGAGLAMLALLPSRDWRRAATSLLLVLIALGIAPLLWRLPLLEAVQFPFRLLAVAEFAAATVLATASVGLPRIALAVLPWVVLAWQTALLKPSPQFDLAELAERHPDVPENLPPGERPYGSPSRWALDLSRRLHSPIVRTGTVIEPRFYFPSAQVRCRGEMVTSWRDRATGLTAHRGQGPCEIVDVMTPAEKVGALASLTALAGLFLWLRRRRNVARLSPEGFVPANQG